MKQIDLVYAAGIIDGEGTITISHRRGKSPWRTPVISFPNTSRTLIEWFTSTFGGCIITKKTYKTNHKQSWECRLCDNAAIEFAKDILPFLKHPEKVYRAKMLAEEYHKATPRNGKYTGKLVSCKEKFEIDFFHPVLS